MSKRTHLATMLSKSSQVLRKTVGSGIESKPSNHFGLAHPLIKLHILAVGHLLCIEISRLNVHGHV
jgi:hypothetical protein